MSNRCKTLAASLEDAMERTTTLFRSLDQQALQTSVYQDGAAWSVKQVLAHLVTIEKSMHWLFRNILDGGPGSPRDFDIDRFNRTQPRRYDAHSLEDLLALFRKTRRETISIVEGMSDQDLDRRGWHVFHGDGTLLRFVRWAYEHAELHENDVRDALKEEKASD